MFKFFTKFSKPKKGQGSNAQNKADSSKKHAGDNKRRVTESTEENLSYLDFFHNNHELLKRFDILEKIGGGSFGQIFKVKDKSTNEVLAMKIEKKREGKQIMVLREYQIMKDFKNEMGFAQTHSYLKNDEYHYLVMSYLGPNLETLKLSSGGNFSLKTALMVGHQIIERIQAFHKMNYLHRDIKPENFVIGCSPNDTNIYLIDFGLSRSFISEDGHHIPFKDKKGMVGTARYVSINTHLGYEQSRRDDLESIGYILIYLAKGSLPWQNLPAKNKEEKYEKILDIKRKTTIEELCHNLPKKFNDYFNYVKNLAFKATPNYDYIKELFIEMLKEKGWEFNFIYDWTKKSDKNPASLETKSKSKNDFDLNESDYAIAPKQKIKTDHNIKFISFVNESKKNIENDPIMIKKAQFLSKLKVNKGSLATEESNQFIDYKKENFDEKGYQSHFSPNKFKTFKVLVNDLRKIEKNTGKPGIIF